MAASTTRRPHGAGALVMRTDRHGRRLYYGKWRDASGKQVMKRIGFERTRSAADGLTKSQAEAELRRLMLKTPTSPTPSEDRVTIGTAGAKYVDHLERVKGRKPTTVQDYRIILATHMVPFFGTRPLDAITLEDVERYVSVKLAPRGAGRKARRAAAQLSAKTVNNHLNFLHGVFKYAVAPQRRWVNSNPVAGVERPEPDAGGVGIRFLQIEQLHALVRAVPDDGLGATDRVLYATAAMTGLRQGELVALRWGDVDWTTETIRVRLNYTRSLEGTPKSDKQRSVPMAPQVAGDLARHRLSQRWCSDDAARDRLVFPHPGTGSYYDASKMRKRFDAAILGASVPRITFHQLRHTFGTTMAASGVDVRRLQEWMGHADIKTTLIYMHYSPRREDAAAIGRAFSPVEVSLGPPDTGSRATVAGSSRAPA